LSYGELTKLDIFVKFIADLKAIGGFFIAYKTISEAVKAVNPVMIYGKTIKGYTMYLDLAQVSRYGCIKCFTILNLDFFQGFSEEDVIRYKMANQVVRDNEIIVNNLELEYKLPPNIGSVRFPRC